MVRDRLGRIMLVELICSTLLAGKKGIRQSRVFRALVSVVLLPVALVGQNAVLAEKSNQAHRDLEAGRFAEAASLYRELVRELPNEPRLRVNLAIALENGNRPQEAIPELQSALHSLPKFAPAWFLLGLAYAQLNKPREAIAPLQRAMEINPSDWHVQFELADAELATGNFAAALEHFSNVTKQAPEFAKAWQGLGLACLAISERASLGIRQADLHSPYWFALLAQTKELEGEPGSAIQLYKRAIDLDAKIPDLHEGLAAVYNESGQESDAAEERKLEAALPKTECAAEKAPCLFQQKDWRGLVALSLHTPAVSNLYWATIGAKMLAADSFRHFSELSSVGEAHELIAQSDQQSGRRLDAIAEWRKALTLSPRNSRLRGLLAESLYRAREYREAQDLLTRLVEEQPENPFWQYLLGATLMRQAREDDALPYLKKAVQGDPQNYAAQENLGRAYLKLGQTAQAAACLERALPIDDGSISFSLSTAYRRMGKNDEARRAFARYQELQGNTSATAQ